MTATVTPETQAIVSIVSAAAATLGRKFEAFDLTPELSNAARDFAKSWQFNSSHWANSFMADMSAKKSLNPNQAKGVLNVIRAEINKGAFATTPEPTAFAAIGILPNNAQVIAGANISQVRTARFRVVAADGHSIAVRLSVPTMWTDAPKGTRKISARSADGWITVGKADPNGTVRMFAKTENVLKHRVLDALETLQNADDDLVYILAYAMEGSECGFCGKELDTVESLTVGYGPKCAKVNDLPWGAKAVPAKVVLAKAGMTKEPEITVAQAAQAISDAQDAYPAAVVPAGPTLETLEATVANAKTALLEIDGADDDAWDTAVARISAAKKALKAFKEAAAAVAPYAPLATCGTKSAHELEVCPCFDNVMVDGMGGIKIRYSDPADDMAAAADLANDVEAGN